MADAPILAAPLQVQVGSIGWLIERGNAELEKRCQRKAVRTIQELAEVKVSSGRKGAAISAQAVAA